MSRKQKKRVDVKFYHHYIIPLSLCLIIMICGIIMIYTNQSGESSFYKYRSWTGWRHNKFIITGQAAIAIGLLAASFIGFMYYKTKKDK